jgi:predicted PurR-regulated permease PerM
MSPTRQVFGSLTRQRIGYNTRMFSPPYATAREWFRSGFFAALGVAVLALLALLLWQFAAGVLAVAAPFVFGLLLALLLDPLADRLERRGMPRLAAVGIVFLGFLLLLVGFFVVIIPALVNEAGQLHDSGTGTIKSLKDTVNQWLNSHKDFHVGDFRIPKKYNSDKISEQLSTQAMTYMENSMGGIQGLLTNTATTIISTIITLIVGFFLLKDIDKLRARLFYLLPERARNPMEQVGRDIGGVFYDYLRGLLIVCTLYGVTTIAMLYGLSFTQGHSALAGYALLVGTLAGVLYAVPYLGAIVTALITFVVAFAAGGFGFGVWAIGLLLLINQVFDNIITPRVVGGGVGLHPVLAIFALIVGADLFHIWGMLLSVPIAASIQVILFRVFPRLAKPTPVNFLRAHNAEPNDLNPDGKTSKVDEGDQHRVPEAPSQLKLDAGE